jgi:DNA polymerase-3 subunit gamma/tau
MTYQVLARKWRPQAFEAVVGQEPITRTLRNALASGRIAHAYLFAGPRGVGKTTTARLVARALLCPARTAPEPCGACDVCREAQAGTLVDIVEIDAASNRRIDDVRALRENVKYAPARGRYKIYIIDEVHQLTPEAFDALLKTLEEPPSHVVFILATTDPRELPATILSRVQRFDFRPIAPDVLVRTLERILTEEQVPFEPNVLPVVVRAAEGSLRDALSLLDTAIAYGNGRLEAATVAGLLGATAPEVVHAFCAGLLARDTVGALEAVDRAARDGEDLGAFARDAIELLRRVLVLKAAPTAQLADLTTTEANALRKLGEAGSLDEILYVLRAFLDADAQMRESPHPRVELEIAAVRATRRPVPRTLEEVLKRLDEAQARLGEAPPLAAPAPALQETLPGAAPAPPVAERRRAVVAPAPSPPAAAPRPVAGVTVAAAPLPVAEPSPAAAPTPPPRSPAAGPEDLATAWDRVVDEVTRKKMMLATVLREHVQPVEVVNGELRVRLTGTSFHRDQLADGAHRELVTQAVRRWIKGADRIRVVETNGSAGDIRAHPTVQAAVAEFDGEIVRVSRRAVEGEGQ